MNRTITKTVTSGDCSVTVTYSANDDNLIDISFEQSFELFMREADAVFEKHANETVS